MFSLASTKQMQQTPAHPYSPNLSFLPTLKHRLPPYQVLTGAMVYHQELLCLGLGQPKHPKGDDFEAVGDEGVDNLHVTLPVASDV